MLRDAFALPLGEALPLPNFTLTTLNLSDTAIADKGAAAIALGLQDNAKLTHLDLSHNVFADRGSEALGHMLDHNATLLTLALDGNTLGERGGRAILRTFRTAPAKRFVSLEGCSFNWEKSDTSKFNPDQPTGRYDLSMDNAYEKSVLGRLVAIAARTSWKSFQNVKINGRRKNLDAAFFEAKPVTEQEGRIDFNFIEVREIEHESTGSNIATISELIGVLKAIPANDTRLQLLEVMCREFSLYTGHLASILQTFPVGEVQLKAMCAVWPHVTDSENLQSTAQQLLGERQLGKLREELGSLWTYDPAMPGGHYRLKLSNPSDRVLLEKLKTQARSLRDREAAQLQELGKRVKPPDTSQHGNHEPFRNATMNGHDYVISSDLDLPNGGLACQVVPKSGVLELDYLEPQLTPGTVRTPLTRCSPISDDLMAMYCEKGPEVWEAGGAQGVLLWLRKSFVGCTLSAEQAAMVMDVLPADDASRAELAMVLWAHIRDRHNAFNLLLGAPPGQHAAFYKRLGWLHMFNIFAPQVGLVGGSWNFNLAVFEQRQVAWILLHLATLNDGKIVRPQYSKADKPKKLSEEVVAEWGREGMAELPTQGTLVFGYDTKAEGCTVDLKARKALAESMLGLSLPPLKLPSDAPAGDVMLGMWVNHMEEVCEASSTLAAQQAAAQESTATEPPADVTNNGA